MADRFDLDDPAGRPTFPVEGTTGQPGRLALRSIVDATFRANPRYELVEFGRLPASLQSTLLPLSRDPEFFGVLLPRPGQTLPIKSVCRNSALLYLALLEAGPIPAYVRQHYGDANHALAELVLDAVLEIEAHGAFFAGAEASHEIHCGELQLGGDRLAALSLDAIRYAEALQIEDTLRLSARLYCYNRQPLSPSWRRRFQSDEQVMRHLGILGSSRITEQLNRHWILDKSNDGWYAWRWAHERREIMGANYKLYLSPTPAATEAAFGIFVHAMSDMKAPCFKVGKGLPGLLRPDKIIAYFQSYEDLARAAEQLNRSIVNCPAQGVPFTAAVGADGLLSWGMDPPTDDFVLPWQRPESWRVWVTNRLAEALAQSLSASKRTAEPWQYALQRIHLAGLDTTTWAPSATIWKH